MRYALLALLVLASCSPNFNWDEVRSCTADEECTQTRIGCAPGAINKAYVDEYLAHLQRNDVAAICTTDRIYVKDRVGRPECHEGDCRLGLTPEGCELLLKSCEERELPHSAGMTCEEVKELC